MINAAAGQQVTPAGAAIKLHFACNNTNNNNSNNNNINNLSNNSSSNYSGLKAMEHKMSNNSSNNINKGWQKVELIRRLSGGEPVVLASPVPSIQPQPMGFYKPTLTEESEDHLLAKSVAAAAPSAAAAPPAAAKEVPASRGPCRIYRSMPVRSAAHLAGLSREDALKSFPVSAYSTEMPRGPFQGAFQGITTGAPMAATKRLLPAAGAGGGGAGPAKITATTTTSLRWLSMPVTKEKPLLAKAGAATTTAAGQPKSPGAGGGGGAAAAAAAARSALVIPQPQRTEDQENAFRRIEDVHNYAKLQDCSSDDADADDDDDDADEEEEEEDLGEDEEEEEVEEEEEELDGEEEDVQVRLPVQQEVTRIRREDTEEHVDVDVVTVQQEQEQERHHLRQQTQQQQQEQQPQQDQDSIRPEHHARRPMNAFLIFCKRHRAIVKERYKTLENRAITKILGDWWAALDEKEKQCFTDLAQQNKDAFFNANPNFKWYKLPAPPLRTLATRPSNAATGGGVLHPSEEQVPPPPPTIAASPQLQLQCGASGVPLALLRRNYFKLADETQMGDLSSLLQVQVQVQVPEKDYALQQVLSETSQFLSAHMPPKNGGKRSLPDSNSSNSSEEEAAMAAAAAGLSPSKKAKSSRSCKGKIYQELVNSGQLAAIAKSKSKALRSPSSASLMMMPGGVGGGGGGGNFADISLDAAPNTPPVSPPERHNDTSTSPVHGRSVSESSSSGFFDLEEKIKELPALSLDAYLQRKRSTKKKKKFSGSKKQRNSNSTSGGGGAGAASSAGTAAGKGAAITSDLARIKQQQQQQQQQRQQQQAAAAAVGSQRRKARKESITRRDVSAIEQEVASILPLTINGCYFFDQSDQAPRTLSSVNVNGNVTTSLSSSSSSLSSSSSPPLSSNSSASASLPSLSLSSSRAYKASTSDLLILAEVAANRTELNSKSN